MNSKSLSKVLKLIVEPKLETPATSAEELQIQNKRLMEEIEFLKERQKDSVKQRLKFHRMISRECVADEEKIQKNYKKLVSSISSLQDRTKEIIQSKEQNYTKTLKFKFEQRLNLEKDKLNRKNEALIQVKELTDKLDLMAAKLEFSEHISENLVQQNKELRNQLRKAQTYKQSLVKKFTGYVELKIGSQSSSPNKPAFLTCSPRPNVSEKSLANKLCREAHTAIGRLLAHKHTSDVTKALVLCNNRMKQATKILM